MRTTSWIYPMAVAAAIAMAMAGILSGCGGQSVPGANERTSVNEQSIDGRPKATSHGGPVRDHVSFVDWLRGHGLRVEPRDVVRRPWLRPKGTRLDLTGGGLRAAASLESYNYDSTDLGGNAGVAVQRDIGNIAPDGSPRRGVVPWHGPSHWFRAARLLVLYVGSDPAVIKLLDDSLGPEFAGH